MLMNAKDRIGDKNWEVFEEDSPIGPCKCGQGKIVDVYLVASHEKVLRTERDFERRDVRCENPNCPSKQENQHH